MADRALVRTTIEIDDALMARAMKLAGTRTKRETVETALKLMIQLNQQARVRMARGKLCWGGDLDATRRDISQTFKPTAVSCRPDQSKRRDDTSSNASDSHKSSGMNC
jgi:Arc/MetJ family transcription regulator